MKFFWRLFLILASAAGAVLAVQAIIKKLHCGSVSTQYIDIPMDDEE